MDSFHSRHFEFGFSSANDGCLPFSWPNMPWLTQLNGNTAWVFWRGCVNMLSIHAIICVFEVVNLFRVKKKHCQWIFGLCKVLTSCVTVHWLLEPLSSCHTSQNGRSIKAQKNPEQNGLYYTTPPPPTLPRSSCRWPRCWTRTAVSICW